MAKRIRDVFYKHRASGMLGHTAAWVGLVTAELPYLFLVSVVFVLVYCLVVRMTLVAFMIGLASYLTHFCYLIRLPSSRMHRDFSGSVSSSFYTHRRTPFLRNVSW